MINVLDDHAREETGNEGRVMIFCLQIRGCGYIKRHRDETEGKKRASKFRIKVTKVLGVSARDG